MDKGKVILTIVVIILSALSASLGYGFMLQCVANSTYRLLLGSLFMTSTPLLVTLIIQLYRKKD